MTSHGPLILQRVDELRRGLARHRPAGRTVGLVPTMGALHAGHLELMRRARGENDVLAISIFVNPKQFGPGEDYRAYPRDPAADVAAAASAGVDLVFAPSAEEMYPPGDVTVVEVTGPLTACLCGAFRPGFFRGVTTVVARLFNLFQPDRAYFGEKDYQQLVVIRRMTQDLRFPIDILSVPTVREPDGLAMSSRNSYLSPEERRAAAAIPRGLFRARDAAAPGALAEQLVGRVRETIAGEPGLRIQYIELRDAETLEAMETLNRPAVLAAAVFAGQARLIDNVLLGVG